jgi:hypothetical protein
MTAVERKLTRRREYQRKRRARLRRQRRAQYPGPREFAERLTTIPTAYREWAASVIWFGSQGHTAPVSGTSEEWQLFREQHVEDLETSYKGLDEPFLVSELHRIGYSAATLRAR